MRFAKSAVEQFFSIDGNIRSVNFAFAADTVDIRKNVRKGSAEAHKDDHVRKARFERFIGLDFKTPEGTVTDEGTARKDSGNGDVS